VALRKGWKAEAEEAIRIKEDFFSVYLIEVSQEKYRERARQLHALGGKKGGEERIIETL